MSDNPALDKIRKLLALAESGSGATPEEAATAAGVAAALMMKYNIDREEVQAKTGPAEKTYGWHKSKVRCPAWDRQAVIFLSSGVAALYGCQELVTPVNHTRYFSFIGQPHNCQMAESWTDYLWRSCKRASTEYLKAHPRFDKKEAYRAERSFRLTFCQQVYVRLLQKVREMRTQGVTEGTSTSTALVVSHWLDEEKKAVQEWMSSNMKTGMTRGPKPRNLDAGAANAGREAGKRVNLDTQLNGSKTAFKQLS